VMCGIGMMVFAQFGKFHEAGIAIPLGLFIVLCATLTFSPPLLRLAGRWAFWPRAPRQALPSEAGLLLRPGSDGLDSETAPPKHGLSFWQRLLRGDGFQRAWDFMGKILLRKPGRTWLASALPMVPFAVLAIFLYKHLSYDFIGNLPANAPSVLGTRALQQHFPPGLMASTTVLLVDPEADFRSAKGRALVEQLTDRLRQRQEELGLADLRSLTAPLGITDAARRAFRGSDMPQEAVQQALRQEALDHYVTDFGERAKIGT